MVHTQNHKGGERRKNGKTYCLLQATCLCTSGWPLLTQALWIVLILKEGILSPLKSQPHPKSIEMYHRYTLLLAWYKTTDHWWGLITKIMPRRPLASKAVIVVEQSSGGDRVSCHLKANQASVPSITIFNLFWISNCKKRAHEIFMFIRRKE